MKVLFLSALLLLSLATGAESQFLKTGRTTYRTADAKAVIVLVQTGDSTAGVFVAYSPDATAGHELHPKSLPPGTRTMFLHFGREGGAYDKVILGKDQEYGINQSGSVTFQLGALRVSLDQDGKSSYLSIVGQSDTPSILGIAGQEVLFNYVGPEAVSLLEANGLHRDPVYRSLATPYEIQEGAVLLINNKPYIGEKIGIGIEVSNECNAGKHPLVTTTQLDNMKKGEREQALRYVRDELEKARKERSWDNLHTLNLSPTRVVAYDYQHNDVVVIERKDSVGKVPVCLYSRADFSSSH